MTTPELIDYIRTQLATGQSKDTISQTLQAQGWNASDVEEAFNMIKVVSNPIQPQPVRPIQPSQPIQSAQPIQPVQPSTRFVPPTQPVQSSTQPTTSFQPQSTQSNIRPVTPVQQSNPARSQSFVSPALANNSFVMPQASGSANASSTSTTKTGRSILLTIVIIIIVLAAIGGGVYYFVLRSTLSTVKDVQANNFTVSNVVANNNQESVASTTSLNIISATTTTNSLNQTATTTANNFVECNDVSCFEPKFKLCEIGSILNSNDGLGLANVRYSIVGPKNNGCEITFKYTKYPDPKWVNKEMTCSFNNKLFFMNSITEVFGGVTNGTIICNGPLYQILHPN